LHLDTIAIIVSFLLNILISGYGIIADKQAFSLNKVFWIFTFLFLSLVPFGQFVEGHFPWNRNFTNSTLLSANGLILLCSIIYTIIRQKVGKDFTEKIHKPASIHTKTLPILLPYFISCLLLIILSNRGAFWQRANGISISNGTLQLLLDKGLRGVCLFGFLMSILLWKEKKINNILFAIVLLVGFTANFPTAIARYWLATFHLAATLLFFKKRFLNQKHLFSLMMIGGTLLAFPIFSIFRYSSAEIKSKFSSLQEVFSFSFSGGDFDAYTSLCSTIGYVQVHGITWGKQLSTVLLFFVPRSFWTNKGIGSGALVNQLPNSDFTNFCSPFIAEGYINFGILGSVCFIVLLAWLIARYDHLYWQLGKSNYTTLFYPAAIGMLFFMLRGDLLSSFAYTVGIYFSGWLIYSLAQQSKKNK
jgi:hypothetical protein